MMFYQEAASFFMLNRSPVGPAADSNGHRSLVVSRGNLLTITVDVKFNFDWGTVRNLF